MRFFPFLKIHGSGERRHHDKLREGHIRLLCQIGGRLKGIRGVGRKAENKRTQHVNIVVPKRLELAHELAPAAPSIALLLNTGDPVRTETLLKEAQEATAQMQLELHAQRAHSDAELEAAFSSFGQSQERVLVIGADAYFNSRSKLLAELCQRHALPAIFEHAEFTEAGGLMSYSGNIRESYRWAGIYAARILKGEKPADLPVQQSTTVELIVNLKTAKTLGIAVPLSLLGRADKIIE